MNELQDSRHWSNRSEIKRDEVHDAFERAVYWVLARGKQAAWAAGGVLVLAAIVGAGLYSRHARSNAAWTALSQAETAFYSGQAQNVETLLSQAAQGAGNPAGLADLLEGDMRYPRGEYDQAVAAYEKASHELSEPLKPYALADKVFALEAAGKSMDCAAAAKAWLGAYPEQLLGPVVQSGLARCLQDAGQNDAYRMTLQKISLQYPGTPWADWANARLQVSAPKETK